MTATRGMTLAEAEARLAAQMPVEEKAKRSHYVIHNNGTAEELKAQAAAFLKFLTSKQMQLKLAND
jgi:dephospho-CoA kinase